MNSTDEVSPEFNTAPSENAVRRKTARKGYKLNKVRDNSRWFADYGPYLLAEAARNVVVHWRTMKSNFGEHPSVAFTSYWMTINLSSREHYGPKQQKEVRDKEAVPSVASVASVALCP